MKKYLIFVALVLMLSACNEKQPEANAVAKSDCSKVEIGVAEMTGSAALFNYSGTVEAEKITPLSFSTIGTVSQVFVEEGDYIKKGSLLASLDKATAKSSHNAAKAMLLQAEDAHARLKKVYDSGSLPEIKWVEMETNLESAKSMEAITLDNLHKCELRSPVAGYIGKRNLEPGMTTLQTTAAFEIMNISKVHVKVACPENEISKVKSGQKASIKVSALNNAKYEGIVDNVGIAANPLSRTYEVKILLNNKGQDLKPGMVCDVDLYINNTDTYLTVAAASVSVDREGKHFVYVANNDRAKKQIVEIGNYINDRICIKSGLNEGQKVITKGNKSIKDNDKISY